MLCILYVIYYFDCHHINILVLFNKQIIVTGVAWLSSVRIVRSKVNSANERNPYC